MIKLLTICGNGMGTSTIIKIKLKTICKNLGIDASIDSCSAGEAGSRINSVDIVITTPIWEKMIKVPEKVQVISLMNLMDEKELVQQLSTTVKQHYPNELK